MDNPWQAFSIASENSNHRQPLQSVQVYQVIGMNLLTRIDALVSLTQMARRVSFIKCLKPCRRAEVIRTAYKSAATIYAITSQGSEAKGLTDANLIRDAYTCVAEHELDNGNKSF